MSRTRTDGPQSTAATGTPSTIPLKLIAKTDIGRMSVVWPNPSEPQPLIPHQPMTAITAKAVQISMAGRRANANQRSPRTMGFILGRDYPCSRWHELFQPDVRPPKLRARTLTQYCACAAALEIRQVLAAPSSVRTSLHFPSRDFPGRDERQLSSIRRTPPVSDARHATTGLATLAGSFGLVIAGLVLSLTVTLRVAELDPLSVSEPSNRAVSR